MEGIKRKTDNLPSSEGQIKSNRCDYIKGMNYIQTAIAEAL